MNGQTCAKYSRPAESLEIDRDALVEDASIDFVWCRDVLNHVQLDPSLREFARVLRVTGEWRERMIADGAWDVAADLLALSRLHRRERDPLQQYGCVRVEAARGGLLLGGLPAAREAVPDDLLPPASRIASYLRRRALASPEGVGRL
ncbi:MAG: class I SAM-dependent methyltransferase [Actinobacteria bacterium]|nr:MAG: class I SAM-dependent methyltransferase [Actinomycetota bacterium]